MRILLINSVVENTTSTGKLVLDIAKGVKDCGGSSVICYSQSSKTPPENSYRFSIVLENKLHALLSRITGLQGYFSPIGTLKLISMAKRQKVDVIHLHNVHSNDICFPMLYKYIARNNIPTVITLHDCWPYTARCFHYTKTNCEQWKEQCTNCDKSVCRSNGYWFLSNAKRMFRDKKGWYSKIKNLHTVGVSEWITNQARISILNCSRSIRPILNWVDTDAFSPIDSKAFRFKYGLQNQKIALAVCGYWSEDKGINEIIALSKRLPVDTRLVLVGEVPEKYRSQMNDSVVYLGRIADKKKLAEVYSAADVYINLSLEESFGMTNAEALACGTPILVYDSTASTEFVLNECGYVSKVGELEDLVYGLNNILSRSDASLSEQCRKLALDRFSYKNNVKQYIDLYKEII